MPVRPCSEDPWFLAVAAAELVELVVQAVALVAQRVALVAQRVVLVAQLPDLRRK